MSKLKFKDNFITNLIFQDFPGFGVSKFYNKDNEEWDSVFTEDFADYLKEEFQKGNINILNDALQFLNNIINDPTTSKEEKNLLFISLFEQFVQDKFLSEYCKKVLLGESLSLFKEAEENIGETE